MYICRGFYTASGVVEIYRQMISDQPERAWQSDSYAQARERFLQACSAAGAAVQSHLHPLSGPEGESLATDVARFGCSDASRMLVMVSGVHGVESFSGSAAQIGWIESKQYESLPDDTAVLMIHLINPWGSAYLRRYNEDNVDLCRNFMEFNGPKPENPAYSNEHGNLALGGIMGEQGELTLPYLQDLIAERGMKSVLDTFMQGQYQYADGFGYGGHEPVWSNVTLTKILQEHSEGVARACVVEFHTGLGPWAYGTLITLHAGEELNTVREFFGPWTVGPAERTEGDDAFHAVTGHTIEGYRQGFPNAELMAVTMEFGSYPSIETLGLMLREHILTHAGAGFDDALQSVRADMLEYHHPKDWEWRCAHWTRAQQIVRQAMRALADERGE